MREDYKIVKPTGSINLQIENDLIEVMKAMESQTKISVSELANTAIKRFVSAHKDFIPTEYLEKQQKNINQR